MAWLRPAAWRAGCGATSAATAMRSSTPGGSRGSRTANASPGARVPTSPPRPCSRPPPRPATPAWASARRRRSRPATGPTWGGVRSAACGPRATGPGGLETAVFAASAADIRTVVAGGRRRGPGTESTCRLRTALRRELSWTYRAAPGCTLRSVTSTSGPAPYPGAGRWDRGMDLDPCPGPGNGVSTPDAGSGNLAVAGRARRPGRTGYALRSATGKSTRRRWTGTRSRSAAPSPTAAWTGPSLFVTTKPPPEAGRARATITESLKALARTTRPVGGHRPPRSGSLVPLWCGTPRPGSPA